MMGCNASVVALISKNGKVLLIKRRERDNDPWSGHIALPGGRRERNEDCKETAIRECLEEVGIKPCKLIDLGTYYPHNMTSLSVRAFMSCVGDEVIPNIQKEEVDHAFWVMLTDLKKGEDNAFYYENYRIWGMTYRILKDIIDKKIFKICIQLGNDTS